MRVLITTFTYTPNKDGVAEACRVMAEGLTALGWNVSVATHYPDGKTSENHLLAYVVNGVTVRWFDINDVSGGDSQKNAEVRRYLDFVRDGRFDLIVNQCWNVWPTTLLQSIYQPPFPRPPVRLPPLSTAFTSKAISLQ